MLRISAILFVFTIVSVCVTYGQNKFIVMSVKGKVEFLSKKDKWKPVKVGQEFTTKNVLRTSYASYVKLMMNNSRLVGVDENTKKPLEQFAKNSRGAKKGSANTILAYAAKQMRQTKSAKKQTEFGAVRGSLEVFNAAFPKYAIMSSKPEFFIVDAEDASKYELVIMDSGLDPVFKKVIEKNYFVYPADSPEIIKGATYYWQVRRMSDGKESDIQKFQIIENASITAIEEELKNLKKELDEMGADDIMHHLIRGVYFEQKQLFFNAYLEYKETILLAPNVQEYRDMLSSLLLQLSLYNEQEYLMR
jgi:hypothetical protein